MRVTISLMGRFWAFDLARELERHGCLERLITSYPVSGSDEVDQVRYVDMHERVCINAEQYFGGVPKAVWDFHVGGYRVCEKWLKDRKGRKLSLDDINHYQKVVAALSETMKIMAEIDAAIASRGGFPLK